MLTLTELCRITGGESQGAEKSLRLRGCNTLARAKPDEVAFLANRKYSKQLATTRAGLVLGAREEAGGRVSDRSGGPVALDAGEIVAARTYLLEEMLEVMKGAPDPLESV